jgi:hypothetical protein
MEKIKKLLYNYKYEVLLYALIQHLFIGILFNNMSESIKIIWPFTIFFLCFSCIGVFMTKSKWKNHLTNGISIFVLATTIFALFFVKNDDYKTSIGLVYVLFFVFIFVEIFNFLLKPSYINGDIISAAACGYFLLIEISVFLLQTHYYKNPDSFNGLDSSNPFGTFIDLVYFCCITFSSIGFGDITPNNQQTKLFTALIGVIGQFYSVVLVGILISKFASKTLTKPK